MRREMLWRRIKGIRTPLLVGFFFLIIILFGRSIWTFIRSILFTPSFGDPGQNINSDLSKQKKEEITAQAFNLHQYMNAVTGIAGMSLYDDVATIQGYMIHYAHNEKELKYFVNSFGLKDYGALHSWFGFNGYDLYQWLYVKLDQVERDMIWRNVFSGVVSYNDFNAYCKR